MQAGVLIEIAQGDVDLGGKGLAAVMFVGVDADAQPFQGQDGRLQEVAAAQGQAQAGHHAQLALRQGHQILPDVLPHREEVILIGEDPPHAVIDQGGAIGGDADIADEFLGGGEEGVG